MNIIEYDKKMEIIMDYYNQAISMMERVNLVLLGFKITYGFDFIKDEIPQEAKEKYPDIENKVEEQKKLTLIELGSIGERVMKYILLSNQMVTYPDQTYDTFSKNPIFKIVLRDNNGASVRSNYSFSTENMNRIYDIRDKLHKLQPLHDYSLLYIVIEILFPNITAEILNYIHLYRNKKTIKESGSEDYYKELLSIFPQREVKGYTDWTDEEKEKYKEEFEKTIKTSGDSFSVLRYAENNIDGKQYDINLILENLNILIEYINLVHEINHDNPNKNIQLATNKVGCIEKKEHVIIENYEAKRVPPEFIRERIAAAKIRIDKLYEINRITEDDDLIEMACLYSCLTAEEIETICKEDIPKEELRSLITNNINLPTYKYYTKRGIKSILDIAKVIKNRKLSIEQLEAQKIPDEQFVLLIWLSLDLIKQVEKHPNIYNYIIQKPYVLNKMFYHRNQDEKMDDLFSRIIECNLMNQTPQLLEMLYYVQIDIFKHVTSEEPSNEEIINNIQQNFEYFANSPIFKKIPIMLNAENNRKIYELFINYEITADMLENIDSNIFCMQYEVVETIFSIMKLKNLPIIIDGEISNKFYALWCEKIKYERNDEIPPLPPMHLFIM